MFHVPGFIDGLSYKASARTLKQLKVDLTKYRYDAKMVASPHLYMIIVDVLHKNFKYILGKDLAIFTHQ